MPGFQYVAERLAADHTHLIVDTETVAPIWTGLIGMADQLIIATTTDRADAQTAWDTLGAIDQLGHQQLRQRAVTLINVLRDHARSDLQTITDGFRTQTADVFHLPDDQALALPGPIRHTAVSQPTRDTWEHVATRLRTMPPHHA